MAAPPLVLSAHTLSGVLPGGAVAARHDFPARLAAAQAAGFAGICLHWRDYAALRAAGAGERDLRAALAARELYVPAIEFLGDWHHDSPAAAQAQEAAFAAAQALGAPYVSVGLDALADCERLTDLIAPLQALCRRAKAAGTRIALEFVAWGQGQSLVQALDLIERSGTEAGLLLDLWHLAWRGTPPAALVQLPRDLVLGLQISDSDMPVLGDPLVARSATFARLPCGAGALDLAGYLRAACALGWSCPIAVEVISPAMAAQDVETAARLAYQGAARLVDEAWS